MFVVIREICSRLQQEKPQQAYTYMVDPAESRVCANDVYIFGYCYIYAISMLYISQTDCRLHKRERQFRESKSYTISI
jgi:hypothetical protein